MQLQTTEFATMSANDFENLNTTGADSARIIVFQPIVSKELLHDIKKVLTVFALFFEAVSVLLTCLSTYIYSLPSMRSPTAKYLVAMNSVDTIAAFVITIYRFWQNTDSGATFRAPYLYLSMFGAMFLTVVCKRMVYCFNLLLSVERFFVITFPLKARHMKIVRSPKLVIAALVLLVLGYHVYLPLKYQVSSSSTNTGYTMTYSRVFKEHPAVFENLATAAKVGFSYVPLFLCLALSVALVVSLKRQAATRRSLQEKHGDVGTARAEAAEKQLAVTILVSCLLFVLLSLPSNTVQVVATYHARFRYLGLEHNLYELHRLFAALPQVATRYTNFLAHASLSTAFRRNLVRLLLCKKVVRKMAA